VAYGELTEFKNNKLDRWFKSTHGHHTKIKAAFSGFFFECIFGACWFGCMFFAFDVSVLSKTAQ